MTIQYLGKKYGKCEKCFGELGHAYLLPKHPAIIKLLIYKEPEIICEKCAKLSWKFDFKNAKRNKDYGNEKI